MKNQINKIHLLSEQDISKIAAGEVVERPSAIVKELFENSVDAGSTEIAVEIEGGGKDLIRVSDNGVGIPRDQVLLAFERHATSKISGISDLYSLGTMGFRGEALHSIAAVAKVVLTTKTAEDDAGYFVEIMGGDIRASGEISSMSGTSVVVTDLFYNTPVRWKFMKTTSQETRSCNEVVSRLAIANPGVSVTYRSDGELVFKTDGRGDKMSAVFQVFGRQLAEELMEIDLETSDISVSGLSSRLSLRKRNRNYIMTFVNGRYVKSAELQRTIEGCYRQHLMGGEFPVSFIFVSVAPSEIDVNVHPAKTEIKFADYQRVDRAVSSAIKMALSLHAHVPSIGVSGVYRSKLEDHDRYRENMHAAASHGELALAREAWAIGEANVLRDSGFFDTRSDNRNYSVTEAFSGAEAFAVAKDELSEKSLPINASADICAEMPNAADDGINKFLQRSLWDRDAADSVRPLRIIGIFDSTFIIGEDEGELYFIDQHAAHEKILYEEYVASVLKSKVPIQMLVAPFEMDVDRGYEPSGLEDLGFDVEMFGDSSVVVRGIPSGMNEGYARNILRAVFDEVWDGETPYDIATKACKAAIKGGDVICDLEAEELVGRLFTLENPYNCPHGRPIIVKMTRREIDRLFRRII